MKKYLLTLFLIFGITVNIYCSPDNSMSITPSATDGTTITASDENTRNNEVSTKFNAHDHNDIDQTANTLAVGDAMAGNKTITANNADTNKPFLRYDDTNNIWVVSVDGTNVSAVVTRTGSSTNYRTLPQTPVQGDILYADGSNWVSLAKGTAGQVLEMNAGATIPEWDTDDSGMQYTDTRYYIGSFTRDKTLASGTQAVTGIGFTPKAVIFYTLRDSAVGELSVGIATVAGDEGLFDNYYGVANTWSTDGTKPIYILDSSGNVYKGSISSWDADGWTITWVKVGSPTGTIEVKFIAFR